MVGILVRFLVGAALAVGAGPLCWVILTWASRCVRWPVPDTLASIGGAVGAILFVFWRRPNGFIHTYIHEHCHLLVYMALHGRTPVGLQVSDGHGGALEHLETDPIRATIVQIAPYTLPLLLLPVLITRHLFITEPGPWRQVLSATVAFLAITHVHGLYHNIRINFSGDQSDLVKVGRPLAVVLIVLVLMLVSAWTLRTLWTGYPSGW